MTENNVNPPTAFHQAANIYPPEYQEALARLKSNGWTMMEITGESPATVSHDLDRPAVVGAKRDSTDNIAANWRRFFVIGLFNGVIPMIIGVYYMDDCPIEPMIPIWHYVKGLIVILSIFLELCVMLCIKEHNKITAGLLYCFYAFLPIWCIVGCVYTYLNYRPGFMWDGIMDKDTFEYCDVVLYQLTFWYLTVYLVVTLIVLLCWCCYLVWATYNFIKMANLEKMTPTQMEAATDIA